MTIFCTVCGRPFSVTHESDGRVLAGMPHRATDGTWCEGGGSSGA